MDPRIDARAIWDAAVAAALPGPLVERFFASDPLAERVRAAPRIIVVGAGKAGPGMAAGLEASLADRLDRISGSINVPEGLSANLARIRLHAARPMGVNEPTEAGVAGTDAMLAQLGAAQPNDVAICLLSGGGSALLPAPVLGISLADKLAVTRLLHRSGATIDEMNCVRKHLSRVKGGRMAEGFRGSLLLTLVISDVVGDPLDVIASGPTAPDPSTYSDAMNVLEKYGLAGRVPASVLIHFQSGKDGAIPETPKILPASVVRRIIGSSRLSLDAAAHEASTRGYTVVDLGSFIEGETQQVAVAIAGIVRSIQHDRRPSAAPVCLLMGGETTVTLGDNPGKGGRNQEFVLAILAKLGTAGMLGVAIISGGTDGEDGPTDAAGAIADAATLQRAASLDLTPETFLRRHDSYSFFDAVGGLIRCGLSGTNVMDVRVVLVT